MPLLFIVISIGCIALQPAKNTECFGSNQVGNEQTSCVFLNATSSMEIIPIFPYL